MTNKINASGQITIPAPLRRKYGFLPGTQVEWIDRDGEIVPRPMAGHARPVGLLSAGTGQRSLTDSLLEERLIEREREDR